MKGFDYSVEIILLEKSEKINALEIEMIGKHTPRDNKLNLYSRYNNKYHDEQSEDYKYYLAADKTDLDEWEKISYNDKGELIDEHGKVIF